MNRTFIITILISVLVTSVSYAEAKTVGLELDVLPYLTGGYYGSVWYGVDHIRFRGVVAKVNTPDFAVQDGYKNSEIKAVAFIVDYFPQENFRGPWGGMGLEFWISRIEPESERSITEFTDLVFTLGGGYVWKFYRDFYLNPWAAMHVIIDGETEVPVGSRTYRPDRFTAEASLKLGWHF
ncbi:MAG: hypothetical protein ACOZB3_10695 [Calditrichota bacterium]